MDFLDKALFKDTINNWAEDIHRGNEEKGFWEDSNLLEDAAFEYGGNDLAKMSVKAVTAQKIALAHSELSEALEADRKDLNDDKLPHRLGLEVELADAVIRIMDLCGALSLDLGGAIVEKLEFNATREYKHGKKY